MNSEILKSLIRSCSVRYARKHCLPYVEYKTAIIFENIHDNFLSTSYERIIRKPEWAKRLKKKHSQVKNAYEMQSSNSSDALLMNIFCHPKLNSWKAIRDLFGVSYITPKFGIKPKIRLKNDQKDRTEIDLAFENIFIEAKLTESDFTQKSVGVVENYADIKKVFHFKNLPNKGKTIFHYQIIRNILASRRWSPKTGQCVKL